MTTPTVSNGTVVKLGATASPTTVLGGVTAVKGPGGSATVIKATTLASTRQEKMIGLPDEGSLSITGNYDATDAGQTAFIAARGSQTVQFFEVDIAGGTHKATFQGFCSGFNLDFGVDALVTYTATVEITGAVTYA